MCICVYYIYIYSVYMCILYIYIECIYVYIHTYTCCMLCKGINLNIQLYELQYFDVKTRIPGVLRF